MIIHSQKLSSRVHSSPQGFALIATISVMVLLTMIALGMLSLATITARSTNAASEMEIARANARLGLMMALNQLQTTLGPDQRVTALADLKNPSAANPKWVGVYGNQQVADYSHKPSDIPSQPYDPVLLNWLVSGNEGVTFSASTSSGSFGQITAPPSSVPYSPTDNVDLAKLTIGSVKAALLVSSGSANLAADYVTAPIVEVADSRGTTRGGYAYWTADEGMKARVNLRENFRQQTTAGEIEKGKGYSFMTSQRSGIEMMSKDATADSEIGDDFNPDNTGILKVATTGQFPLLASGLKADDVLKNRVHDLTAYSKSVIADSYAGGLKHDISALIYGGSGPSSSTPIFTPESSSEFGLPTWGHVRSWANLTAPLTSPPPVMPASAVRPYTPSQTRFGPVILLSQLALGVEIDPTTTNAVRVVMYPALILWNPYSVGIPATDYELGYRFIPGAAGKDALKVQMKSDKDPWKEIGTCNLSGGNSAMTAGSNFFRFLVEGQVLPAGEAHIYLAEFPAAGTYSPGVSKLVRAPESTTIGYLARPVPTTTSFSYDPSSFSYNANPELNPDSKLDVRLDCDIMLDTGMDNGNRTEVILTIPGELASGYTQATPVYQALLDMNLHTDSYRVPNPSDVQTPSKINVLKALSSSGSGSGPMYMSRSTIMMESRGNPSAWFQAVGAMNSGTRGERNRWIASQNPIAPYVKRTANERTMRGGSFSHGSVFSGDNNNAGRKMLGNSRVYNYLAGFGGSPGSPVIESDQARQAPLIDVLPTESTLMSLGQLQHAQFDPYGFGMTYTFGNGSANVNLARATHYEAAQVAQPGNSPTDYSDTLYDIPWHTNRAIWDKYFVSTVQSTLTQSDIDGGLPLPNARMTYHHSKGKAPDAGDLRPSGGSSLEQAAANLMVAGGFNVNSTSVNAWRAVLTGTNKLTVPDELANPQYGSDPLNAMMPRFFRDVRMSDTADYEGLTNMWSAAGPRKNLYRGNRELVLFRENGKNSESVSDAQDRLHLVAHELAEKIVEEVRLRGPFISLGDFVNRRLSPGDEGIRGTLQAAIDKMTTNQVNPVASYNTVNGGGSYVSANATTGWDEEHYLGAPKLEARSGANAKHAMAPKHLTQGDILTTIGPSLSARSDTFTIRSYGEALGTNGNVTARAWCEAVVQRTPDYVDTADQASVAPADLTVEANKSFGRSFEIVSFRWLSKEEL